MDHKITFFEVDSEDADLVRERFSDAYISTDPLTSLDQINGLEQIEILSVFVHSTLTADILKAFPSLQCICTRSVGYDHIDLEYCQQHNISVCHVPDYGSHVIAEHVFALLLGTIRHIHAADKRVEAGRFDYHGLRGISLKEKTIGIIGTGRIGRAVAHIAHGFGMHILAVDQCRVLTLEEDLGVEYVPLNQALQRSDILTLHLPATDETYHLFNADAFSQMKTNMILVNTARGELIDSAALLDALHAGTVAHALLDVLEDENDATKNTELIAHDRVDTTPHIAFYAEESMQNMYDDCFRSIQQFLDGQTPEHIVHPVEKICDLPRVGSE